MIEIKKNVVFVRGLHNGAIYDLNSGNVFSINNASCNLLDKYIIKKELTDDESKYIDLLVSQKLFDKNSKFQTYIPDEPPLTLDLCWLEITQACNCQCIHCYEGNTHTKCNSALSLEEWKDIIDQIHSYGVKRVVIIGGEPCIHPQINEIAKYTSSLKIDTTIFSNGTHITEQLKTIVKNNGIKMKFSLYGHCAETHDNITKVPGSFNKLVDNIKYFIANDVHVNVAVVIMKENERYQLNIINFLKELGVKKYKLDVIRETFIDVNTSHMPTLEKIINSVKRTSPSFPKTYKERFDKAFFTNTCWYGKIAVSEDGNVMPCVFARNISLGNVKTDSIKDIIHSQKTAKHWGLTFDSVSECKHCEFRFACKDCRPLAEASASFYAKNPRCTYDVCKGEWR